MSPCALVAKLSQFMLPPSLSPLARALVRADPPSTHTSRVSRVLSFLPPAHRRPHPAAVRRDSALAAPALKLAAAFFTDAPEAICRSPVSEYPCDGMCLHPSTQEREDVAHVVCLSACGDPERAWERNDGKSRATMTSVGASAVRPSPVLIVVRRQALISVLGVCIAKAHRRRV
jgi:hypothetical protein